MDKTQLPVPPPKMQLKINNKNKTVNLINDGEVNILKTPGLTEVSFEVLLPNSQYPFVSYFMGFFKPEYFLNTFDKLKSTQTSFQFIVCRLGASLFDFMFDTNLKVSLEDYEVIEDASNGRDVMVSIRLKQYKPYATKVLNVKEDKDGKKTATVDKKREAKKEIANKYKVIAGQTLLEICRKQLGDSSHLQEIIALNNIVNPNKLEPGQVIKFVK
ncbi:LysM peptidoglycan-binding domain-containing protein [Sporomusa acidovorans]|nr:LysM domain-containing protein [Sporomusa acidovorans]